MAVINEEGTTPTAVILNLTASPYSAVPDGCVVGTVQDFIPWNNPDNLLSLQVAREMSRIKSSYILPLLFVLGAPGNVLSMLVFYRQGLEERIHLCLFALAFADLLYVTNNTLLYIDQFVALFTGSGIRFGAVFQFMINNRLVCINGMAFSSMFLSAIIASERCACILFPLKAKTVVSVRPTTAIVVTSLILFPGLYMLVALRYEMICVWNPVTNTSTMQTSVTSPFYLRHKELVDQVANVVLNLFVVVLTTTTVIIATTITGVKLRQAVSWRAETSSSLSSSRELALTRMLVATSLLFAVCYTPKMLFGVASAVIPELKAGHAYHNLFQFSISLLEILACVNSSLNFAIYFRMGSRFREVFWDMFGRSKRPPKAMTSSQTVSVTLSTMATNA